MAGSLPVPRALGRSVSHTRTSTLALYEVTCQDRSAATASNQKLPVKLVVFDLDETLTLATFLPKGYHFSAEQKDTITLYNFQTPFVTDTKSDRVQKLKDMLETLRNGLDGSRGIAILSMNQAGVGPIVKLLQTADLDRYFDAVWSMPWRERTANGMWRNAEGRWTEFDPPLGEVLNHKADILASVTKDPRRWLPQLSSGNCMGLQDLLTLSPENIVLVDDQRSNFQNGGLKVLRYCKVARYDENYRGMGKIKDMGGLGAHSDNDFESVMRFVDQPWDFPETIEAKCGWEKYLDGFDVSRPVRLVVFGFDETLTLATFMPDDAPCSTEVGWTPKPGGEWTEAELVQFNFEPPKEWGVHGSRVEQLAAMCSSLQYPLAEWMQNMGYACPEDVDDAPVTLAILTRCNEGAVAVLNLLKMAKLDQYFSAIWRLPVDGAQNQTTPNGVYKDGTDWKVFAPPVTQVPNNKVDLLDQLVKDPSPWLPSMATGENALQHEDVMLVDDDRVNFVSIVDKKANAVLRFCKVARYDVDEYYTSGMQVAMGGLGAKNVDDYKMLVKFAKTSHLSKPDHRVRKDAPASPLLDEIDDIPRSPFQELRTPKTPRRKTQGSEAGSVSAMSFACPEDDRESGITTLSGAPAPPSAPASEVPSTMS